MKNLSGILMPAVAAVFFALAGRMNEHLVEKRAAYRLNQAQPLENSPPLVAFTTVALGGFRGLLADLLWIRAATLQDEGKYFELVQLSDWITKLEPRFAVVWAYQAWNMSYNISVLFSDPSDRWRWVRNGIVLLRDDGLFYNPGDARLYRELGWMFQHKIGMSFDQANLYYKKAWADEMTKLLGSPHPDYAALTPDILQRLREDYKLDPDRMQTMDRTIGPLDWRLAQSHALYWAQSGQPWADGFEAVMLERMRLQSLGEIFRSGRLIDRPSEGVFAFAPRPDYLPVVLREYRRALETTDSEWGFQDAYDNFRRGAVFTLLTCGEEEEAKRLLAELPSADAELGLERFAYEFALGPSERIEPSVVREQVAASLEQSRSWNALGESKLAGGYERIAEIFWNELLRDMKSEPSGKRKKLPRYEHLRREIDRNRR